MVWSNMGYGQNYKTIHCVVEEKYQRQDLDTTISSYPYSYVYSFITSC